MSDKDHPTTEYDDYGSENNYDTGYDDGIESDGYTSENYESGEYESDDYETGDYASDDYDAEFSDSDSYASDDYDAEDGDPEYYDSERYAAGDYDDTYDQGEYDAEPTDPAAIDPDSIPPEALEPYYDKSAFKWLKNMNRAKLIRLISMLVFSVAILVFASIAWFSMNKDVGTSGMGVKVGSLPFDIATSEPKISYEQTLKLADSEYQKGVAKTLKNKDGEEGTYYMLSGNGQKLILQCKANPEDQTGQSGDKSISPGDWDKLNLYIVSNIDGAISATIRLEVIPFAEIEKKDNEGNTIYQKDENEDLIVDENGNYIPETELIRITTKTDFETKASAVNNEKAQTESQNYIDAANYLKGHIMFFGGLGDTTNADESERYYFTTPYVNRTLSFSKSDANSDIAYEVPLYWMWPNTLGQIALRDNTGQQRKGYPIVSDDDSDEKDSTIGYLWSEVVNMFTNWQNITQTIVNNADTPENFRLLSEGYNKADFSIGTYISYFMIEITVEGQ